MSKNESFKCELEGCEGVTSGAFCEQCTNFLVTNRTYLAVVCSYCNSLIKISENTKMEVELVPSCSNCKHWQIK